MIDRGRLIAVATPQTLSMLTAQNARIDFEGGPDYLFERLGQLDGIASVRQENGAARVELANDAATQDVLALLVQAGVTSIRTSRPSLEEVYVHVMSGNGNCNQPVRA
jgi:ABC-2 type transport system ATP-binding protein